MMQLSLKEWNEYYTLLGSETTVYGGCYSFDRSRKRKMADSVLQGFKAELAKNPNEAPTIKAIRAYVLRDKETFGFDPFIMFILINLLAGAIRALASWLITKWLNRNTQQKG